MMPPLGHERPLERVEMLSHHLDSLKHAFARAEGIVYTLGSLVLSVFLTGCLFVP